MKITAKTKICMIIGDPVEHSLSPAIHNAGYEALGIDDQYVYVAADINPSDLKDAIRGIRAMQIKGVSVTIPHKEEVIKYLDEIDEVAKRIGAVNTIVNSNGKLIGYNTDWLGIVLPLEKVTNIVNKNIAIIGAGGSARAAAYGVTKLGGRLTIYNRTVEKAANLTAEFGGQYCSLEEIESVKKADVIINTTSIGLGHIENDLPIPSDLITENHVIFDAVYKPKGTTKFIKEAQNRNAKVITGIEMLLNQGYAQFKLFTGQDAPENAMRRAIEQVR